LSHALDAGKRASGIAGRLTHQLPQKIPGEMLFWDISSRY